jgi:manganese efflux pump family protein
VWKLLLFVLPLGLDTFAVSAALGLRGLPRRERLRVTLLFSSFEMAMPVVGLLLGQGLGRVVGGAASYVAVAVLFAVGGWILLQGEDGEHASVGRLSSGHGLALLGLGLSISLDELAMGFTIGLLHLALWRAVILIGLQAFLVAQLGLQLGARLSERVREGAERLAAFALIGLGVLFLVEQLTRS